MRKATHPFGETSRGAPYLYPYACFACRSCFKRSGGTSEHVRPCVRCGAPSVRLARKFKPPKRDDLDQWRKCEALVRAGFHFESAPGAYPEQFGEVGAFAAALAPWLAEKRRRFPDLIAATEAALR